MRTRTESIESASAKIVCGRCHASGQHSHAHAGRHQHTATHRHRPPQSIEPDDDAGGGRRGELYRRCLALHSVRRGPPAWLTCSSNSLAKNCGRTCRVGPGSLSKYFIVELPKEKLVARRLGAGKTKTMPRRESTYERRREPATRPPPCRLLPLRSSAARLSGTFRR